GEVAVAWGLGGAPEVLVDTEPLLWADGRSGSTAGHVFGPLVASQVRPIESLSLGSVAVPLAVNQYTGALPQWPARLLFVLTGSVAAVQWLHLALGALILVLVHRILCDRGCRTAAAVAVLVLATDWSFVFYRRILGGTELALQAGILLALWGAWCSLEGDRRGWALLWVGVGLGISAKVTFLLSAVALGLAYGWECRNTHRVSPEAAGPRPRWPQALALVLCLPQVVTWVHHAWAVPTAPHVVSHDFPQVQVQRLVQQLSGGSAPVRESLDNVIYWAMDPVSFLGPVYGAQVESAVVLRGLAWAVLALALVGMWARGPSHEKPDLPVRFILRFLVLQVALVWLVARDLHHLAQATPALAILVGLVAGQWVHSVRSSRGWGVLGVMLVPWVISGVHHLARTDAVLSSIEVPTFASSSQHRLVSWLRSHGVKQLVACDYELYGLLELLAPEIRVRHGWGAASWKRGEALAGLVSVAEGGHFIELRSSAPMIYNLAPGENSLMQAAGSLGLEVTVVDRLDEVATLYRVSRE
ncbi:MAG: glycosyltransferase family 39 protein, partial [Myxococcota bacterium]|nr:glycosyltransferase family 39 protein [Myxococcota bacterium]